MSEMPVLEYKKEDLSIDTQLDDATNLIINYLPVDLDESNLKVSSAHIPLLFPLESTNYVYFKDHFC
jgi:hypothetical protein